MEYNKELYEKYLLKHQKYNNYMKNYMNNKFQDKIECECGKITNKVHYKRHLETKYHQKRVNNTHQEYILERFMNLEIETI